jgi:hypothetical protein
MRGGGDLTLKCAEMFQFQVSLSIWFKISKVDVVSDDIDFIRLNGNQEKEKWNGLMLSRDLL